MGACQIMADNNFESTQTESQKPAGQPLQTGRIIQSVGINMVMVGILALLGFLIWQRFAPSKSASAYVNPVATSEQGGTAAPLPFLNGDGEEYILLPLATPLPSLSGGVFRRVNWRTVIPTRPRVDVMTYTVQLGDSLFSIAYNFGLKPETLLWGNYDILEDNPHLLKPNQVLRILPVNGVYYEWKEGDDLKAVAEEFKAELQAILNYPGNHFDLTQIDEHGAGILAGTFLIIPGGSRPVKDWGPPAITRTNPASARYYGEGSCGEIYEGAIGVGTFVWPTTDHGISGYTFDPVVHPGIDISGAEGNPVYATDSGVIVYAGWSDYGYGYLIVIDHGTGWQSAYAHLSSVAVSCGQSVYQGGFIGGLGNTGNSSGPHLHFELSINGVKVNPLDYVR